MPSTREHEAEVTRLRHTFRMAVIAAALGATIGAGAMIAVGAAVYSVVDRSDTPKAASKPATPAEKSKASAQAPKVAPDTQASAQPQNALPNPRRVEEPPAQRAASCADQTWPYLDGKCLTPADDRPRPADVAGNEPAAPIASETPATPGGPTSAQALAPSAAAGPPTGGEAAVAARSESTGSGAQPQPALAAQPDVATTGAAPPDPPADFAKKPRKKVAGSRSERPKLSRPDESNRRLANRAERAEHEPLSRASRPSDSWDRESDDDGAPRTVVIVPARSDLSSQNADRAARIVKKMQRPTGLRPDQGPPVEERDQPDNGGRDFFGSLFGRQRD